MHSIFRKLPGSVREFLINRNLEQKLDEVNQNTANYKSFVKRFYNWFNGFMVVKYLNTSHHKHYTEIPVERAASTLLKNSGMKADRDAGVLELLQIYREIQRSRNYLTPL